MEQSLYHEDITWKSNFVYLLDLPHVLLPELTTVTLDSESFNWKHIARLMAKAHTYSTWVDNEDKTLRQLGAVLQGLLSKALNEKYRGKLLRDCLDFCFFAKVINFFAKKRNSPLRCIATFEDDEVAYDELVIKKVVLRTHYGDPTKKYTKERDRFWKDPRTGSTFAYTQAATTSQQKRTSTSHAAHQQAGRFAKASRKVYHATAARDTATFEV